MASDYGLVSFIQPPKISKLTQPDHIEFETKYSMYSRKVSEVIKKRSSDSQIKMASIRDCMDDNLLQALCIMGEIEGASSVEEATTEEVKDWFDAQLANLSRGIGTRLRTAVNFVRYKLCNEDPAGVALTFCVDAVRALDQQNASDVQKDCENSTKVIDMLQEKVEPAILRKKIRDERKYWSKDERGSIAHFKKHLVVQAILARDFEEAILRMKQNKKHDRETGRGAEYEKIFEKQKYAECSSKRGQRKDG